MPDPPHLALDRVRRIVVTVALVFVALVAAVGVRLVAPVAGNPVSGFDERRGRLARAAVQNVTPLASARFVELRLGSSSGLEVELSVRIPAGHEGRLPTALLLGGKETGRDAARLVTGDTDVVLAAMSYPFAGDPDVRGMDAVLETPDIQRALLDTVPAIRLAADFLVAQSYVDPDRLELVGVSLGAFFVGPAGALDGRFRRVWIVHGAARPRDVIDFALRDEIGSAWLRGRVATMLNALVAGDDLDAERWVARISPRPVIAINALDDERLPRAAVVALHDALGDPHEVIWMPGEHVQPDRPAIIEDLASRILVRVSSGGS